MKTGFTSGAGYCLTATMLKDNMRIIATVMGEPDSTTRNNEVSGMLDYAYATVGLKQVLSKNSVVKKINLPKAKSEEISIVPMTDVNVLYEKANGEINPTYSVEIDDIKVPVKVGDKVGKLYVMNDGKRINQVDLTVKDDVTESNLIELYFKNLKSIIKGNIKFV